MPHPRIMPQFDPSPRIIPLGYYSSKYGTLQCNQNRGLVTFCTKTIWKELRLVYIFRLPESTSVTLITSMYKDRHWYGDRCLFFDTDVEK